MTQRASSKRLAPTRIHGPPSDVFRGTPAWRAQRPTALEGQPSHMGRRPTVGVDDDARGLGVDAPAFLRRPDAPGLFMGFGFRPGGRHHAQHMELERAVPTALARAVLFLPLLRVRALADVAAPVVEQQGVKGAGQGVILLAASEVVAVGHGLSVSETTHSRIDQIRGLATPCAFPMAIYRGLSTL